MGMAKKGQMLSSELLLALSIFLLSLIAFLFAWNYLTGSYEEERLSLQLEDSLFALSDTLVLTPGNPQNWEATVLQNATSFGLATSRNVLSDRKLSALQSLNSSYYDSIREKMGAGQFELYLQAHYPQSNSTIYSFGREVDLANRSIVSRSAERLALLNDSVVYLKVMIWRVK